MTTRERERESDTDASQKQRDVSNSMKIKDSETARNRLLHRVNQDQNLVSIDTNEEYDFALEFQGHIRRALE